MVTFPVRGVSCISAQEDEHQNTIVTFPVRGVSCICKFLQPVRLLFRYFLQFIDYSIT